MTAQNQHYTGHERRNDSERRARVSRMAAEAFNRETVKIVLHGTEVDPGELWDACVKAAVEQTADTGYECGRVTR